VKESCLLQVLCEGVISLAGAAFVENTTIFVKACKKGVITRSLRTSQVIYRRCVNETSLFYVCETCLV